MLWLPAVDSEVIGLFQDNFAIYRIDQQLRELSGMLPEYSVDGFDNCIEDDDDDDDEDYVDDGVYIDGRMVRSVLQCSYCIFYQFVLRVVLLKI